MSALDAFLADLEDEEDDEEFGEFGEDEAADNEGGERKDMDVTADPDAALKGMAESLKSHSVHDVVSLMGTERMDSIMKRVDEQLEKMIEGEVEDTIVGPIESNPEYQLIVEANNATVEMDDDAHAIHKFIRDIYTKKFPELENLVLHPLDYARTVQAIGNETDLTLVDLTDVLPSQTVMVVTVSGNTSTGQKLPQEEMDRCLEACRAIIDLNESKSKILEYVQSRMAMIAPNLSAIVGAGIAAQLMSAAGGLTNLSKMPACNVQILGGSKGNIASGFNTSAQNGVPAGYIFFCDLIQIVPPMLKTRAARLIGGKVTLAARVDSFHSYPTGELGAKLREEMEAKLSKWQEPPPAKAPKPLPIPDDYHKKKRGGKRYRKQKERLAMTEVRKQANRLKFGAEEDEGFMGETGRVRVAAPQQVSRKKVIKQQKVFKQRSLGSSGATSGLSSSVAFTPVHGLELLAPQQAKNVSTDKYFSNSGFAKVGADAAKRKAAGDMGPPAKRAK